MLKPLSFDAAILFIKEYKDVIIKDRDFDTLRACINVCYRYGDGVGEEDIETVQCYITDYARIMIIIDAMISMELNEDKNSTLQSINIEDYELIRKTVDAITEHIDIFSVQELIRNSEHKEKLLLLISQFEVLVWRVHNGWLYK